MIWLHFEITSYVAFAFGLRLHSSQAEHRVRVQGRYCAQALESRASQSPPIRGRLQHSERGRRALTSIDSFVTDAAFRRISTTLRHVPRETTKRYRGRLKPLKARHKIRLPGGGEDNPAAPSCTHMHTNPLMHTPIHSFGRAF